MDQYISIVGLVSATLTTSAFLPQVIKVWRTRSTKDLSPMMFSLFFIGILGWLIYGIFIQDLPMILANTVTIVLAGIIMFFIFQGKQIKQIDHIGIYVNDINTVASFYEKWFNGEIGVAYANPLKKFTSKFVMLGSGARIELMHIKDDLGSEGQKLRMHLSISVGSKSEVDRFANEMSKSGIVVLDDPRKTGDGYYECVVADPEGNRIEITA